MLLISLRATWRFHGAVQRYRPRRLATTWSPQWIYLERRRPGRPVLVLGTSMGAAAAVFASRELAHRVGGYILESPYEHLRRAVRNRTENALPPLLDWVAYQGLALASSVVLPELDAIAPVKAIKGIPADIPVLILAGGVDRLARPPEARALFQVVKSHARLILFEKAGHLNFLETDHTRYRQSLIDFVHACSKSGRPRPQGWNRKSHDSRPVRSGNSFPLRRKGIRSGGRAPTGTGTGLCLRLRWTEKERDRCRPCWRWVPTTTTVYSASRESCFRRSSKHYRVVVLAMIGDYSNWAPVKGREKALIDGTTAICKEHGAERATSTSSRIAST